MLRQRVLHVLPDANLADKNFPLDTGALAQHFQNAIKHLSLGISQKVVIFRVFQQEFLGQLWPVLEEANQNLIDAGVLSDLKVTFKSQHKGESDYDEVMAQKEKEKEGEGIKRE